MKTAFHQSVPVLPGMISEFGYEYLVTSTLAGRPNASRVQLTFSVQKVYCGTVGLFGSP